jgi:hypothetical protein
MRRSAHCRAFGVKGSFFAARQGESARSSAAANVEGDTNSRPVAMSRANWKRDASRWPICVLPQRQRAHCCREERAMWPNLWQHLIRAQRARCPFSDPAATASQSSLTRRDRTSRMSALERALQNMRKAAEYRRAWKRRKAQSGKLNCNIQPDLRHSTPALYE